MLVAGCRMLDYKASDFIQYPGAGIRFHGGSSTIDSQTQSVERLNPLSDKDT